MARYIGTSGWAYREWKPAFYPEDLPQDRFLEHYARRLSACEINATFYRLQPATSMRKWAAATPAAFRFAVKAHRRITHGGKIAAEADFLGAFLRSVAPLEEKLGAVLFQFPPQKRRADAELDRLLAELGRAADAARRPAWAFEFRHASWAGPAVAERIERAGGAVCFAETEGCVPERLPAGAIAYVRLRAERYEPAARDGWRALLQREAAARDVYAFAKHEGVPAGDPFAGVGLAEWLASAVAAAPAPPE